MRTAKLPTQLTFESRQHCRDGDVVHETERERERERLKRFNENICITCFQTMTVRRLPFVLICHEGNSKSAGAREKGPLKPPSINLQVTLNNVILNEIK